MKKTYLIKDKGRGLIENLTPDKLFDIASGNNSGGNPVGVDNSNDYSINETQVGKFIYLKELPNGIGTDLVSKPKYRKTVYSYLNAGSDNISISNIEQLLFIQGNYNIEGKQVGFGESNFFKPYAATHRIVNERVNLGYYLGNSNIIIHGYMKTIDPENIIPNTEFALADGIRGIITLEYTKISDTETFIEEFERW